MTQNIAVKTVVVGLLILSLAIVVYSPNYQAFAAKKIIDAKQQGFSSTSNISSATICGTTGSYTFTAYVREHHFTLWDNGHSELKQTLSWEWRESSGKLAGHSHSTFHNAQEVGGLPVTLQSSFISTCPGSGHNFNIHFGVTIGADGLVKQIHVNF